MAKRNQPSKQPQLQHGDKSVPSRHDKRQRLRVTNDNRQKTEVAKVPLTKNMANMVASMQAMLHARIAYRLPIILAGALLAKGRRTASSWFRAAGVLGDWDCFYDTLSSIGKSVLSMATPLLKMMLARFDPGPKGYWTMVLDDSPTKRFGRHVEGANIHHNPTPGPADGDWLYGHNWVCLAMLMAHPLWGVIALPILSMLYIRQCDIEALKAKYGWEFHTKHQLALKLITQAVQILRALGSKAKMLVVFDGAYAAKTLLNPLVELGVSVISRLRSNAKLFDIPEPRVPGQRGRPRKFGKNRINLAEQANDPTGWVPIRYNCRGNEVARRYKTFVATTAIVNVPIRVVIVDFGNGQWAAYFSTDINLAVQKILETVADRWAIEEFFHDTKEVWGAGKQQVRNIWSNVGCWNMNSWLYTLVELASWESKVEDLVDRSDRPWDNATRRPSHADRRRSIVKEMLEKRFFNELQHSYDPNKIKSILEELFSLAA
jgi:hypothetical protein